MSKLTKTSDAAGITGAPQVINPASNLPEVDIIDASQTKSDAKGAGTAAQVENAELAEKLTEANETVWDKINALYFPIEKTTAELQNEAMKLAEGDFNRVFPVYNDLVAAQAEKLAQAKETAKSLDFETFCTDIEPFFNEIAEAFKVCEFGQKDLNLIFSSEKNCMVIFRCEQTEGNKFMSSNHIGTTFAGTEISTAYYYEYKTEYSGAEDLIRCLKSLKHYYSAQGKNDRAIASANKPFRAISNSIAEVGTEAAANYLLTKNRYLCRVIAEKLTEEKNG